MSTDGSAHGLLSSPEAVAPRPPHSPPPPDSHASEDSMQHSSGLRRPSAVEPAPAMLSGHIPDLHAQFSQPGVEELRTPRADDINRDGLSDAERTPVLDYFTPTARSSHSVESPPTARRQPLQSTALSQLSYQQHDVPDASAASKSISTESLLAHDLAFQRDAIASTSALSAVASTARPVESIESLRLQPRRSLTDHPNYVDPALQAHPSADEVTSSPPTRFTHNRPHPITLHHLRASSGDRQSRTVGNTPMQTPQLYSPRANRPSSNFSHFHEHGAFPSPYLHPAQPQAPKETSKATRDVDTFSGRKTINQYEIQSEIGKGTHGKVKLARSLDTDTYVAIKIVQRYSKRRRLGKATTQEDQVKQEIAVLKKALHPNVVSMIEVIDDPDLHKIYLVLEFCELHDVKWRTPGESEILLMEHRRLQREAHGDVVLDVPAESDRIMRSAIKRRDRLGRSRRAPLSRINSQDDFCWSLEYAGDSGEDDDQDRSNMSHSVSAPSVKAGSPSSVKVNASHKHSETPEDLSPTNTTYLALQPIESAAQDDSASSQSDVPELSQSWDMRELHRDLQRRMSHLDETANSDFPVRKASIAESSTSHLTELMETEIDDEEMRYVPLLTIPEARRAFRDALLGLEYLHYHGIIHRDIKPENLLRKADQSIKISDFGVSYLGKPPREGTESEETSENEGPDDREEAAELAKTVGTPAFYAPELCTLEWNGEQPRVSKSIDVWALGVVLYCMLYARLPFSATNEFVMMRKIAEDDVFVSRKRLKAVDQSAVSRPGSHSPAFRLQDHRLPHELAYEDIDDDLYDLLRRLFQKDPNQRIKVKEIKHHPWILRDIQNPLNWQEETDPGRFSQGKKIEPSKQEVTEAIVPLKILERAKSVAKKVGGVFGLGSSKPSRRRGQSSANSSEVGSHPSSASATGSRRRDSFTSDDGPTTSRSGRESSLASHPQHHEHPLSQSVTASPNATTGKPFEEAFGTQSASLEALQQQHAGGALKRPALVARQESSMSTAASIKTIRQSDINAFRPEQTSPTHHDEHHHGHRDILSATSLGAIFGGAGRSIMRSMSRSRRGSGSRASSNPPSPRVTESNAHLLHGEPSTAVSNASAAGLVQQPMKSTDNVSHSSPSSSPHQSKRASLASGGVSASGLSNAIHEANKARVNSPVTSSPAASRASPVDHHMTDPSDAEFYEVKQQLARRRLLEDVQAKERSRPASAIGNVPCPPSPDDEDLPRSSSFLPLSPVDSSGAPPGQASIKPISSNSSEDRFNSGISQSTSYPSVPSVVSANSSVVPDDGRVELKEESAQSSEGTAGADRQRVSNPAMTTPTGPLILTEEDKQQLARSTSAVESDEEDSEEEDFLVMNRPKSRQPPPAGRRPSAQTSSRRPSARQERRASNMAGPGVHQPPD